MQLYFVSLKDFQSRLLVYVSSPTLLEQLKVKYLYLTEPSMDQNINLKMSVNCYLPTMRSFLLIRSENLPRHDIWLNFRLTLYLICGTCFILFPQIRKHLKISILLIQLLETDRRQKSPKHETTKRTTSVIGNCSLNLDLAGLIRISFVTIVLLNGNAVQLT